MDVDQLIFDHAEWKSRFHIAITHHDALDVPSIGSHDCCNLGRWLHEQGNENADSRSAFAVLMQAHADFHREAARVASLIQAGDFSSAKVEIEYGSAYSRAAQAVAMAIISLHEERV